MKKRKKYLIAGGGILTLLALAGLGFSFGGDYHCKWSRGFHHGFSGEDAADFISWKMDRQVKELDLDAAQRQEFENIKATVLEHIVNGMEKRRAFHELLHEEIQKESPDLNRIVTLGKERLEKMPSLIGENLDLFVDFYNRVLTDDQRAKVIEMIRERWD